MALTTGKCVSSGCFLSRVRCRPARKMSRLSATTMSRLGAASVEGTERPERGSGPGVRSSFSRRPTCRHEKHSLAIRTLRPGSSDRPRRELRSPRHSIPCHLSSRHDTSRTLQRQDGQTRMRRSMVAPLPSDYGVEGLRELWYAGGSCGRWRRLRHPPMGRPPPAGERKRGEGVPQGVMIVEVLVCTRGP